MGHIVLLIQIFTVKTAAGRTPPPPNTIPGCPAKPAPPNVPNPAGVAASTVVPATPVTIISSLYSVRISSTNCGMKSSAIAGSSVVDGAVVVAFVVVVVTKLFECKQVTTQFKHFNLLI